MAALQNPVLPPMRRVFDSIFPRDKIKPPAQPQRFYNRGPGYDEKQRQLFTNYSRIILGIGDEEFEFGEPERYGGSLSFKTYYSACPSMSSIPAPNNAIIEPGHVVKTRNELFRFVQEWQRQLGGDHVRKAFAAILDKLITEFVNWAYAGVYEEESEIIPHLRYWIENIFARYVVHVLDALSSSEESSRQAGMSEVNHTDVQKWVEMAITRLGALRVDELFDMVVDWDETKSGIDDLKHYISNPATRTYLTSNFNNVLSTRLLHPGASTVEILQLYISIIRAFRRLDPKGVLLDRVARIIRRYLRDRDDTVKVIVIGLLSDAVDANGNPIPSDSETFTELALELSRHDLDSSQDDNGELDWDNMEWMPDPIDAAPDYRKSKNTDVIGSLISLFETKDVFVKELQTTLADRLLRNKPDFDRETSVLEHLKIRFGDSALQACEVMLRDVTDSKKVDSIIRQDQGLQSQPYQPSAAPAGPTDSSSDQPLHAKILSRLFWPTLPSQSYKIPAPIQAQQSRYERGFMALKQSRKLTWLDSLGQVEVELDLADRVFRDEVLPWQAAVIYAFQTEDATDNEGPMPSASNNRPTGGVTWTIDTLALELSMSPTLVRSACIFWASKRILLQSPTDPDTYTVLETLPASAGPSSGPLRTDPHPQSASAGQASAATAAAATASAVAEAAEADRQSKISLYTQFIISMLTNQGAMPLPRIAMMLGIVVPGGFPFSNEELREFLSGMCRERVLEVGHGGVYRVVS
jgi:anaphase-promoting complex subunit 2